MVAAAISMGLMVFAPRLPLKILGVIAMVIPHLVGAPRPDGIGRPVPPEVVGHFVVASIVVSAIFWVMLGGLSATFYRRLQ